MVEKNLNLQNTLQPYVRPGSYYGAKPAETKGLNCKGWGRKAMETATNRMVNSKSSEPLWKAVTTSYIPQRQNFSRNRDSYPSKSLQTKAMAKVFQNSLIKKVNDKSACKANMTIGFL